LPASGGRGTYSALDRPDSSRDHDFRAVSGCEPTAPSATPLAPTWGSVRSFRLRSKNRITVAGLAHLVTPPDQRIRSRNSRESPECLRLRVAPRSRDSPNRVHLLCSLTTESTYFVLEPPSPTSYSEIIHISSISRASEARPCKNPPNRAQLYCPLPTGHDLDSRRPRWSTSRLHKQCPRPMCAGTTRCADQGHAGNRERPNGRTTRKSAGRRTPPWIEHPNIEEGPYDIVKPYPAVHRLSIRNSTVRATVPLPPDDA
jgi:hypothetical protein